MLSLQNKKTIEINFNLKENKQVDLQKVVFTVGIISLISSTAYGSSDMSRVSMPMPATSIKPLSTANLQAPGATIPVYGIAPPAESVNIEDQPKPEYTPTQPYTSEPENPRKNTTISGGAE